MSGSRCAVVAPASTYRRAGRCEKRHGVRAVAYGPAKIPACAGHRHVIESGRAVLVDENGARK